MQHKDEEDALAIAQNGGVSSSDEGDMDGDADGDLDDDMMDKISSSPSIEDGGFYSDTPDTTQPLRISSLPPLLSSYSPTENELSRLGSLPNSHTPIPPNSMNTSPPSPNEKSILHSTSDGYLRRERTKMDPDPDAIDDPTYEHLSTPGSEQRITLTSSTAHHHHRHGQI